MIKKTIITIISTYVLLLTVFVSAMTLVHTLPSQSLYHHAGTSLRTLQTEGLKHRIAGFPLFRVDNFTDALMISTAVSADDSCALHSAIQNRYTIRENDRLTVAEATCDQMEGKTEGLETVTYERYWHGYLTVLRPLLLFTDHQGLRTLNCICFGLLTVVLLRILYTRSTRVVFGCFLTTVLVMQWWMVPMSLQYSAVFYIALGGMVFILRNKEKMKQPHVAATFFTVMGALTAFFDLLTVPLVTLGLPLILFLTEASERKWRDLCLSCLYWGSAYGLLWTSKWGLAHCLTGFDIMEDAIRQVSLRTSTSHEGFDMSVSGILHYLLPFAAHHRMIAAAGLAACAAVVAFTAWCFLRNRQAFMAHLYLPVIALMPMAWCLLTRNHSVIHYWFVWRVFSVSLFALLLFYASVYGKPKDRGL